MIGKVPPDALATLLEKTGAADPDVLLGAAYGEDAAVLDLGDRSLVVSTDPISLAIERVGTLGVAVAANDVAVSGARPRWLTNAIFLPDDDPETLRRITTQLDEAATAADVAIVGGHSEYDPDRSRPLLVLTCLGTTDAHVTSGGARPGDVLVLTKGAGIEATAILASDFRGALADRVPAGTLDAAVGFYEDVSVVAEAMAVREFATAMHDPTEGGLVDGLLELATASGVTVALDRGDVPLRPETRAICDAMGVDPLAAFGSGALLAAVPADRLDDALAALDEVGVDHAVIGRVVDAGDAPLVLDGEAVTEPVRDELYRFWE